MDMKDKKLTIIGDVDPVDIVGKLKKWHTEILTVGPKEEKKAEAEKKKEDGDENKKKAGEEAIKEWVEAYRAYNPYMTQRYCVRSVEDDPRGCVIC